MPLRVVVADDEPLPRERLVRLLREAGCEVAEVFENGQELMAWMGRGESPDALFLDVLMPGLTGLEVVVELEQRVPIVLVTAHTEYTLAAFEHAVFDYLLKPVTSERLQKTLSRLGKGARNPAPSQDRKPLALPVPRFPVRAGEGLVFLELRRVTHFELIEEWVWAWSQGERYRSSWTSLTEVEDAFPDEPFCRIQRHILLRPGTVLGIRTLWGRRSMVRIQGSMELEVSRAMTPRLKEILGL
ncbi:MAG: response regulator transcription factor [Acidobacteria bacterium]|nr:response regulator transcription factor [Acidobacteriota bacterium]